MNEQQPTLNSMPQTPRWMALRAGYKHLLATATIATADASKVQVAATRALSGKTQYQAIAYRLKLPWLLVAAIHMRESSFNFKTHLHNGDPLSARTTHVPQGRPAQGKPPFSWEESAIDALTMPGIDLDKITNWTVERMAYEAEDYNGRGYFGHENSPYIWSCTSLEQRGLFTADKRFDANAWDGRPGCAALWIALQGAGYEWPPSEDVEVVHPITRASEISIPRAQPGSAQQAQTAPAQETWTMTLKELQSAANDLPTWLPTMLSALGRVYPPAIILAQLIPLFQKALEAINAVATHANVPPEQALAMVDQHLTPGQPNSPALG